MSGAVGADTILVRRCGLPAPTRGEETDMPDLATRRAQLEERLAFLDARLHEIDAELDSHQSKDWEELATEREGDETLERLGQSGQAEIAQIRAALGRMDAGEYGICVACGDEISEERLDLLPFTPFCRKCAR
jgi:RNA polymerase-binding transcription factor DksA